MIPSVLAAQLRHGIQDFLLTTFPITTPFFSSTLSDLLASEGSVFRGPFLSLKLPFLAGEGTSRFFPDVLPAGFRPYRHQEQAFSRLGSPRFLSTLIATGTGSGKTESFLYPILDHCARTASERGIKAILIYPMNALASDQARRFARAIHASPALKGRVTAGLYIGGEGREAHLAMGPDHLITDRETLRTSPPSILLTNYKMLDYLLIRPDDRSLWSENGPETLRFLAVDELHTFDGAQGADLACLIRRLKARLKAPAGFLSCVGTSATLGDSPAGMNASALRSYAELLFGEPFTTDAIITETVETTDEFLRGHLITRSAPPGPEKRDELDPLGFQSQEDYLRAQHRLWFDSDLPPTESEDALVTLGRRLKEHGFLRNLLVILDGKTRELKDVREALTGHIAGFAPGDPETAGRILGSFLALLSAARVKTTNGTAPLVQVRLQLWLRELNRMVALVENRPGFSPRLAFADDLSADQAKRALPVVHCRDCGMTGWAAVYKEKEARLVPDLKAFYEAFFHFNPSVRYFYPGDLETPEDQRSFATWLCPHCLHLGRSLDPVACGSCGHPSEEQIRVFVAENTYRDRAGHTRGHHGCAFCDSRNSLTILGSRAASLTSVALSQLYASRFNDDKKILAFSDSVQDASHRAGFFRARTYTFNFRTAIEKAAASLPGPIPLPDFPSHFTTHWRERLSEPHFIATFLPPDMEWLRDWDALRKEGKLPEGSSLPGLVERRIDWEVHSELTFKCRIGRTLEKAGNLGLAIDPERLEEASSSLARRLSEEIGPLRDISLATVQQFILGFLVTMKNRGAVSHPDLKDYIESGGNLWSLQKRIHLPRFGTHSRAPAFLTSRPLSRFNTLLRSSVQQALTWFEDWLIRSFSESARGVATSTNEIWKLTVEELEKHGLLFRSVTKGNASVWGVPATAFLVTRNTLQLRCERCGSAISGAVSEETLWNGTRCPRYRCGGCLRPEARRDNYYRSLYSVGDLERIYAEEHTGLLEREERERIEDEFKNGILPGCPNLLSCTPTLEMGIDIGDLSSLALCSIPPKSSNYLQRIGRAGRTDGNSLILAVANGRPHDLYFYFEPSEMIGGLVEPPGCFLNASAVLERQLTGHVFDRWVESGISKGAIPDRLGPVLDAAEKGTASRDVFPNSLLHFFELNRTSIEETFLSMFTDDLKGPSRVRLLAFARGDDPAVKALPVRIVEELQEVVKERKSLRNAIRRLTERIEKVEAEPAGGEVQERELDDLRQEKSALTRVAAGINGTHVLEFLTDSGLLPNYAFPESGVQLKSVIYRKNDKATSLEKKYETRSYVYERPAASAIVEFAPASTFYAQGRKLTVDQVNVDLSKPEPWRFCAACSYMEKEGEHPLAPVCPHCDDPLWSDAGQRRSMLRMKQVLSSQSDRDSRSQDDSEDREPEFFQRNMFVVTNPSDIESAYSLPVEEIPFGFEFFRRLTIREVNLGRRQTGQANLRIAGADFEDTGFAICKACGKVKGARGSSTIEHALHCRYRPSGPAAPPPDDATTISTHFLYREFDSEGIRILLPVAAFDVDLKVESFVAALDLGLRKRFRGDPGHLLTAVMSEPIKGSGIRKRFLALYDGVPGGTGYLKELMHDENGILDVLEMARDVLAACPCQHDPSKDGCYRCLLAYRGRHDRLKTSRREALDILIRVLKEREKIRKVAQIATIPLGSLLESELELRFIEALRRSRIAAQPVQLLPHVVKGKPGWFLKAAGGNWLVEPQVVLGPDEGVAIVSRADFVLYPEGKGSDKPIAVFTDGFEFHADPAATNQRLGVDTAQRLAIVRSGRFRVFSLTWDDVMERFETGVAKLTPPGTVNSGTFDRLADRDPAHGEQWKALHTLSTFDLLLSLLDRTVERDWEGFAQTWAASFLEPGRAASKAGAEAIRDSLLDPTKEGPEEKGTGGGEWQTGRIEKLLLGAHPAVFGVVFARSESLAKGSLAGLAVTLRIYEGHAGASIDEWKAAWREFLWMVNVIQFLRLAEFVSTEGLSSGRYGALLDTFFDVPLEPVVVSPHLEAFLGLADPAVHPLVQELFKKGLDLPEAGYELTDEVGEIRGTAELGWETQRVAVLLPREEEYRHAFEAAGFEVFLLAEVEASPGRLELSLGKVTGGEA